MRNINHFLTGLLVITGFIAGGFKVGQLTAPFLNEEKQIKIVAHRGASKFAPENTILK